MCKKLEEEWATRNHNNTLNFFGGFTTCSNSDMWGSGQSAFTPLENCTIAPNGSTVATLALTSIPGLTSSWVKTDPSKALSCKHIEHRDPHVTKLTCNKYQFPILPWKHDYSQQCNCFQQNENRLTDCISYKFKRPNAPMDAKRGVTRAKKHKIPECKKLKIQGK